MKNYPGKGKNLVICLLAGAIVTLFGAFTSASASGITLNVIGPHEYDLPVNYKSFNALVQYGYTQFSNEAFDNNSKKVAGSGNFSAVGLTKYVRFFTLDALPNVGVAWEVIQPEVSVQNKGLSVTGLGDTITGFATWYKPSQNSTLGIQSFVQVPVGTEKVSDKTWKNLTSILYDVNGHGVDFVGDIGVVVQSTQHNNGADDIDPGIVFHTNNRLGYRASKTFEPFLGFDYQYVDSSKNLATGVKGLSSYEFAVGAGSVIYFTDSIHLTVRYDYGVAGKNTDVTNALNFKMAYIW